MALSSDYIRTSLQNLYGNTITGADIRAWCNMNDANYQTVTKKLDEFKTGRGKWNLEITKEMLDWYTRNSTLIKSVRGLAVPRVSFPSFLYVHAASCPIGSASDRRPRHTVYGRQDAGSVKSDEACRAFAGRWRA